MENKEAQTEFKIYHLLRKRWSPKAYSSEPVETEKLQRIFEAARWAPSSFNEQPWRFIVGIKGQGSTWQKLYNCLKEKNQQWAINVPVLVLAIAKNIYTRNNKNNNACEYDLGQAVAHLSVQAMHEGIYTHQMGGYRKRKVIVDLGIPEVYVSKAIIALGHLGELDNLPEDFKEKEQAIRQRKKSAEFVFESSFGEPSTIFVTDSETELEPKAETALDSKSTSEQKSETVPGPKPESKVETATEPKTETTPEPKANEKKITE